MSPTVDPECGPGEAVIRGACVLEPPARCACRPLTDGAEFAPKSTCDGCRGFGSELESKLLKCVLGLNSEAVCCNELEAQMGDACAGTVREDNLFMLSYLQKCNVTIPECQVLRAKPTAVKTECDWCAYYEMPDPPTTACAGAGSDGASRECCESLLEMKADPCLLARVLAGGAGFLRFDQLFTQQCGLAYSDICPKELRCGLGCSDGIADSPGECEDAGFTIIPKALGSTDGLCLAEGRWVGECARFAYFFGANATSGDAIPELVVDSAGRSARFLLRDCVSRKTIFTFELTKVEMTKAPSYKQSITGAVVYSLAYELGVFLVTNTAMDLLTPGGKARACAVGPELTNIAEGCGSKGAVLLADRDACPVRFVNVAVTEDTMSFSLGSLFKPGNPSIGCNKYNTAAEFDQLRLVSRQLEYTRSPTATPTSKPTLAPSERDIQLVTEADFNDDKDQDASAAIRPARRASFGALASVALTLTFACAIL
jgi:hypothetical protein